MSFNAYKLDCLSICAPSYRCSTGLAEDSSIRWETNSAFLTDGCIPTRDLNFLILPRYTFDTVDLAFMLHELMRH